MSTEHEKAPAPDQDGVSADQVGDYLRRHPDFLAANPEVLEALITPSRWTGGGVVDMQQFMLERLREEIDNLRLCAQELIETSRNNMSSQTRAHAGVLALLSAGDLEHLMRIVSDDLPLLLDVDVVTLCFEPARTPLPGLVSNHIRQLGEGTVNGLLDGGREVLLQSEMADDGTLFGAAAGLVQSAALSRLRPGLITPTGLLALGSRSYVFDPGQGTELIGFLTRALERCLYRWLEKPA